MAAPQYRRALLKISGEALAGERKFGLDHDKIMWISAQIARAHRDGRELGIVIGGGNIIRGADASAVGVPDLVGDHMGMVSTVLNAIALRWSLAAAGVPARVMCSFVVGNFVEIFDNEKALEYLGQKHVLIFAGGTGNPCFTTDSAAALRAVQIDADVMIKATQADGVFDKDPKLFPDAVMFESITTGQVLEKRLGVMDAACVEILGRKKIPTIVLDLHVEGNISRALAGEKIGTIIRD